MERTMMDGNLLSAPSGAPQTNGQLDVKQDLANAFVVESLAVNLDEVNTETLRVQIRDLQNVPVEQPDGTTVTQQRLVKRVALIDSFVPMSVFNQMIALRQQLANSIPASDMANAEAMANSASAARTMQLLGQAVLLVWRLSEPDMTLERLENGLTRQQLSGLFARFFNDELHLKA